jgi:hypothetical protein
LGITKTSQKWLTVQNVQNLCETSLWAFGGIKEPNMWIPSACKNISMLLISSKLFRQDSAKANWQSWAKRYVCSGLSLLIPTEQQALLLCVYRTYIVFTLPITFLGFLKACISIWALKVFRA